MNNLKRILSLALASVMVMGMMVVGASAADFADSDKINADYTEAVETMNALGIINGFEDSTFRPEDTLTRAQMAMMLATIFRNGRTDFKFAVKENPSFTDIKSTDWYAGAVEYATNMKIVGGRGNGIFDPQSTVTGIEAARMILNAMGYAQGEGDWQLNTVLQAEDVGIYDNVAEDDQIAAQLTRQAAAQMLYNGINKAMADAETVTETYYELTYKVGTGDAQKAGIEFESSTAAYLFASINDFTVVNVEKKTTSAAKTTLATKYLSLDSKTGIVTSVTLENNGTYTVVLDGSDAKTYTKVKTDYTGLLGRNVKVLFKAEDDIYGITAADTVVTTIDGSQWTTLVGANAAAKKEYTLADTPRYCDINGAAATASDIKAGSIVELINSNADAKIEAVRITNKTVAVLGDDPKVSTDGKKVEVSGVLAEATEIENVKGYEDLKKGDTVLYVVINGVTVIEKAAVTTGTITAISKDGEYTVNGKKLLVSALNSPDLSAADFKTEFNFFLDNGGNIIAMAPAGETPVVDVKYAVTQDFGYVTTGASTDIGGNAGVTTYKVQLIFTDGTVAVVEMAGYEVKNGTKYALKDSDNVTAFTSDIVGTTLKTNNKGKIVSYTTNKDGQYILTEVGTDLTGEITGGKAQFATNVVGNKDTIFLVKVGTGTDAKLTVCTGVANLGSATGSNALTVGQTFNKANGTFVTLAYLEIPAFDGSTLEETAYFINKAEDSYTLTANGYEVQAIVDGEVKTLVVDADNWDTVKTAEGLKKVTYKDGKVTKTEEATGFAEKTNVTMAAEFVKTGDGKFYSVGANTVIYKIVDGKATLVETSKLADALKETENKQYNALVELGTGADEDTIKTMYITVVETDDEGNDDNTPAQHQHNYVLDSSVTETNSTCTTQGQKPVYKCDNADGKCDATSDHWLDNAGTTKVENNNDKKPLAEHTWDKEEADGVCTVCNTPWTDPNA